MSGVTLKPGWKPFKSKYPSPLTSEPNRCFCAAFENDKNKSGADVSLRHERALWRPRDETEMVSFIGLPWVLLVCFGKLAVPACRLSASLRRLSEARATQVLIY